MQPGDLAEVLGVVDHHVVRVSAEVVVVAEERRPSMEEESSLVVREEDLPM